VTEPADRPILLLLAGLLCDGTVWTEIAARLSPLVEVRIAAFTGVSSIGAMAEQALAAAPSRFAVAGHSMGGRVALEMVRRAPDRVGRIALLNTGVHPTAETEPATRGRLVDLARREGMAALADAWLPPMMSPASLADAALMARLSAMVQRSTPDGFTAQIQALLDRPDARPVLSTLTVPTLLLSGTDDAWSPPAQHSAMRDLVPHARLVILDGAGHMAPAEQPGARNLAGPAGARLD
jgi:pimeloyl-ACP methyl ester carboxylesterase